VKQREFEVGYRIGVGVGVRVEFKLELGLGSGYFRCYGACSRGIRVLAWIEDRLYIGLLADSCGGYSRLLRLSSFQVCEM